MHKIVIFCLLTAITMSAMGQKDKKDKKEERKQRINALIKQEEEGVIAYRKHNLFGFKLTNDGYGGFYEHGRAQSIRKALLFQLDFTERKNVKEQKQTNPFVPTAPFIYGKINYFYPLKLGVQQQYLLGNKSNKNGVAVSVNYGGGISLALLRPYYLEINDSVGNGRRQIKYNSSDSTTFGSATDLRNLSVASAGFTKGWNEISVTPGVYVKGGLRFDYGRYNEVISAIEVGVSAEYYTKKIPLVLFQDQKQLFFNVYFSMIFGKRK
jgi:hypothetical protein